MGALPVFTLEPFCGTPPRAATLTKENLKLSRQLASLLVWMDSN